MRIRQVKPEFFKDARLSELSDSVRLFYIGLWLVADDGGYFRVDVPEIGIELMAYRNRTSRERSIRTYLDTLHDAERIELLHCGHGYVPRMTNHQRFAAENKRVYTFKREHESGCPADTRGCVSTARDGIGKGTDVERQGKSRNGTSRASDPEGPRATVTEFQQRVPRPA